MPANCPQCHKPVYKNPRTSKQAPGTFTASDQTAPWKNTLIDGNEPRCWLTPHDPCYKCRTENYAQRMAIINNTT